MTLTFEQALNVREFHYRCTLTIGPKGSVKHHPEIWRRNGQTKTWKTRPGAFQVPVKFGLRAYDYVTEHEDAIVAGDDCPVCALARACYPQTPVIMFGQSFNMENAPAALRALTMTYP